MRRSKIKEDPEQVLFCSGSSFCICVVPVRGAGCVIHMDDPFGVPDGVAVPVRGAGCVFCFNYLDYHFSGPVAVPVRGAGCVYSKCRSRPSISIVAVPVRGAGCV